MGIEREQFSIGVTKLERCEIGVVGANFPRGLSGVGKNEAKPLKEARHKARERRKDLTCCLSP